MGERKVPRPPAAVEVVGVAGLVVTCGSCTPDADTLRRWPVCFDFDFNMLTALKGWVGLAPVGGRVPSILLETLFMGGVPSIKKPVFIKHSSDSICNTVIIRI